MKKISENFDWQKLSVNLIGLHIVNPEGLDAGDESLTYIEQGTVCNYHICSNTILPQAGVNLGYMPGVYCCIHKCYTGLKRHLDRQSVTVCCVAGCYLLLLFVVWLAVTLPS